MDSFVSAAELFPSLSLTTSTTTNEYKYNTAINSLDIAKNKQQRPQEPVKEVKFTELMTSNGQGRQVLFRQLCAQPEYDTLHPLQIRLQLEYPELYRKHKQNVAALLEQKRQLDYAQEQQYRRMLFGISE